MPTIILTARSNPRTNRGEINVLTLDEMVKAFVRRRPRHPIDPTQENYVRLRLIERNGRWLS